MGTPVLTAYQDGRRAHGYRYKSVLRWGRLLLWGSGIVEVRTSIGRGSLRSTFGWEVEQET